LLIGLISAYAGIYFFYKRKIERFINDPKNSNLLVRTELIISDNGIINKDEFSEVNYNWNAITKKVINKDYIYLFLNSVQAIVIPKKALSNEEEKQLSDLLSRNLSLKAEFSELYPT
jgi:K+/H+ antiporter YhaU regulatory subunit KhtT